MPIGKFSLNITNCPAKPTDKDFAKTFAKTISDIVPHCFLLELTNDNLMKLNFVPKKDYNANKLHSGILQLCSGTELIVDETALSEGKIDDKGLILNFIVHSEKVYKIYKLYKS